MNSSKLLKEDSNNNDKDLDTSIVLLNKDTIGKINEHLPLSDASRFNSTCKTIYNYGMHSLGKYNFFIFNTSKKVQELLSAIKKYDLVNIQKLLGPDPGLLIETGKIKPNDMSEPDKVVAYMPIEYAFKFGNTEICQFILTCYARLPADKKVKALKQTIDKKFNELFCNEDESTLIKKMMAFMDNVNNSNVNPSAENYAQLRSYSPIFNLLG